MKTTIILLLYDAFMSGETVSRAKFCKKHMIAERTFYRYLHELTEFFRSYKPVYMIDGSQIKGSYVLKNVGGA